MWGDWEVAETWLPHWARLSPAGRDVAVGDRVGGGRSAKRWGIDTKYDNPSVICFANATSLYTREALVRCIYLILPIPI